MKALGLIVEYNPFHNGHFYHLQQSKKKSEADVTIAVMSGNFLQRGEPAMVSKWTRTEMALRSGVDVVVELPYAFATQRADRFAFGAVSILNALMCDEIIFGSESGEIHPFLNAIKFIDDHRNKYEERIQSHIQSGISFPTAASKAFLDLQHKEDSIVDLSKPNNILGFHYINALRTLSKGEIKIDTIKRIGAGYHDKDIFDEKIASATGIRTKLIEQQEDLDSIRSLVPETTYSGLTRHYETFGQFQSWDKYFGLLKYKLITSSAHELSNLYECVEGIENRLLDLIMTSDSFTDFLSKVKTKRYTWTRLQRLCTHILTNTKKTDMDEATRKGPSYIRLLGMSETGRQYINQIKKSLDIPLVSTVSKHDNRQLVMDIQAARTYVLGYPKQFHTTLLKQEYSTPPLRFERN